MLRRGGVCCSHVMVHDPPLGCSEFYEKQQLLPPEQLETLVVFLRRLLFRLCWADFNALSPSSSLPGVTALLELRSCGIQVSACD
jgi:hypothetical protein